MSLTKHSKEESLYLNNCHDNSRSSSEESSEDEDGELMTKVPKINKKFFIHNDLRGARNGGPNDDDDKKCECCGKKFRSKYYYLSLNFECADTAEDHPRMSLECATKGVVCCLHHFSKKVENYGEEYLRDE